jgi:hypothetical protein
MVDEPECEKKLECDPDRRLCIAVLLAITINSIVGGSIHLAYVYAS